MQIKQLTLFVWYQVIFFLLFLCDCQDPSTQRNILKAQLVVRFPFFSTQWRCTCLGILFKELFSHSSGFLLQIHAFVRSNGGKTHHSRYHTMYSFWHVTPPVRCALILWNSTSSSFDCIFFCRSYCLGLLCSDNFVEQQLVGSIQWTLVYVYEKCFLWHFDDLPGNIGALEVTFRKSLLLVLDCKANLQHYMFRIYTFDRYDFPCSHKILFNSFFLQK